MEYPSITNNIGSNVKKMNKPPKSTKPIIKQPKVFSFCIFLICASISLLSSGSGYMYSISMVTPLFLVTSIYVGGVLLKIKFALKELFLFRYNNLTRGSFRFLIRLISYTAYSDYENDRCLICFPDAPYRRESLNRLMPITLNL